MDFDFEKYNENRGFTGKEVCKLILQYLKETNQCSDELTASNIWNYSPTGELALVFFLRDEAFKYFRSIGMINEKVSV